MGDANADWLAYGLEDAFSEKTEIGIVHKHRTDSGLIRYDPRRDNEWPQVGARSSQQCRLSGSSTTSRDTSTKSFFTPRPGRRTHRIKARLLFVA
jgi:hypothetical protein